jgi:hypothetical protein
MIPVLRDTYSCPPCSVSLFAIFIIVVYYEKYSYSSYYVRLSVHYVNYTCSSWKIFLFIMFNISIHYINYSCSLWQVFRFALLSISVYPVNYSCSPWYRRYSCSPCQVHLSICLYSVLLACTIYTKNLDVNKASSLQTVKGFFQRKKRSAQDFFWWIFFF